MRWRNYCQALPYRVKIEHIPGSIVQSVIQFVIIVCKVEGKAFLKKIKRSRPSLPASFFA